MLRSNGSLPSELDLQWIFLCISAQPFFQNIGILMKSIERVLGSSLIAFSVHFMDINMSRMDFRHHDFSELVFLICLILCLLNRCLQYINSIQNSKKLLLMYWTLNSDKIRKSSLIAKYRTRDSEVVFLDSGDDEQVTDP